MRYNPEPNIFAMINSYEFSKLESNFKSFCNINSNITFKNKSSTSTEENFENGKILAKFENNSKSLIYLLNTQKAFNDKNRLGFNANDTLTNKSKQIKFVKPSEEI